MTATPRPVKSLTQVNTADAAVALGGLPVQADGQIARLPDGGYVVVWTDSSRTHNPNGSAIVGQRYDSLGNKVGGEVNISQFSAGDQFSPAITALPNGNVAIAFVDTSAGNLDLYVRVFDPSLGLVRTDTIDVSINVTFTPSIAAFADGSYVITYTAGSGVDTDIVARVVSSSGTVGAQFDIDNQTDNRDLSEVATLANGNFVVTYVDEVSGSDTDTAISYAVFSPAGAPVVGPATVPGGDGLGLQTDPDVATLREGGFVIVWTDPDLLTNDIRASLLDSNGTPIVSDFLVNTTTTGVQNEASVVALADGGFLVTWEDENTNLVRAQRFDVTGNKIGAEFTVKDGTSLVDSPEAALLTDGGRIVYAVGDVSTGDADVMTSIWRARDVSHDFDGDGKSGVLWRNDNGQVYFWEMDGLGVKTEGSVAHAPVTPDWHLQGTGDFDGDGNNDILWRHDNGQVYFWEMNGLTVKAQGPVAHAAVPNDWHIQGVSDFDADGKSDILWRHDSGQVYFWEMDGLGIKAEGSAVHAAVPNDYQILGTGDFNGDGHGDIIWRHDSGQIYFWEMNDGLQPKQEGPVAHAAVTNDWHIQGTGDFNGDGNSDIIWRHDSGQVYIWEMDGLAIKAEGGVAHAAVPNDWHIQNVGDFNGDANSDIIWRHDSGQVYIWEMDGLAIKAEGGVAHAPVSNDWHIFGPYNLV